MFIMGSCDPYAPLNKVLPDRFVRTLALVCTFTLIATGIIKDLKKYQEGKFSLSCSGTHETGHVVAQED